MLQQLNRALRSARLAGLDLYEARCCHGTNAWQGKAWARRDAVRAERRLGRAIIAEQLADHPPSSGSR